MTYLLLCAGFLIAALAVLALPLGMRNGRGIRPRSAAAIGLATLALLVLTAVFDNVMIGLGLFAYDPAHTSGLLIGQAPIEDFTYPLAAVILLPALWSLLRRRARRPHDS
ncbi:lycopene cyclase domain-containing protein [Diaminobutyricimonas sp. LJ205]|uniref:lycopene cyclase domain-containing protein n=1 Tax=Diaminobutyricimonas sp. LJ205 TaxID=2683590 RepID=UPI0012F4B3C3|nr:lycopene cyclase domain-containing protein [Diaminobutyricimonas sp. LJ205]